MDLLFNIAPLKDATIGEQISYDLDQEVSLQSIETKSPLRAQVIITRLENSFAAAVQDLEVTALLSCQKCLEPQIVEIKIPMAEREFLISKPESIKDPFDNFHADMKSLEIDIEEMLRQEISLHFPFFSVCSSSCKGICSKCGKNKNKKPCECPDDEPEENKPLSALKELLKDQ